MQFSIFMFISAIPVALMVLWLTVRHPGPIMIAAFGLTPFQTALFGEGAEVRMGVVDVLAIILCLPLAVRLVTRGQLLTGRVGLCILVFLSAAAFSSAVVGITSESTISLIRMVTNTLLPVLLFANLDLRLRTYHRCFAAYLVAVNVLSVSVLAAFARGGFQASMYTLGMNKNFTGPVLGCGLVVAAVYVLTDGIRGRRGIWLAGTMGLAAMAMVLTLSRGAWIATAAGTLIALGTTRNVRLVVASGVVGGVVCGVTWRLLPSSATDYATDVSSGAESIKLRLEYIDYVVDQFKSHPVFGVGVGLRKIMEPHNVLILTAGEGGVVGVATFLLMFVAGFSTTIWAWRQSRQVMAAKQLCVMATVVLCITLVDGLMDVYWRRGIGFMGWAGVGIALLIGRSIPAMVAIPATPRVVAFAHPRRVAALEVG